MNIALILAGGRGFRMNSGIPKQFLPIASKAMILRTIDAFQNHNEIDKICVVCAKEWTNELRRQLSKENYTKLCGIIDGGANRQESSFCGLSFLNDAFSPDSIVLIHDAARPLVSERIISESISSAKIYGACLAVIPAKDTTYESFDGETANCMLDRETLYLAQTPQTFRLSLIFHAFENISDTQIFTDDAGILISQGFPVKFIHGDPKNIKITSQEDIAIAEEYLNRQNSNKIKKAPK